MLQYKLNGLINLRNQVNIHTGTDAAGQLIQILFVFLGQQNGINARVIDMFSLKPFDKDIVLKAAKETGKILTVEEHSMFGGLGATVAEITAQECPTKMRILGIPDENVIHAKPLEVFHHYGIDYEGIYKAALELVADK